MTEDERIDAEIAKLHAYGESLGDKCPLWLSAMGEADWEAERYFRGEIPLDEPQERGLQSHHDVPDRRDLPSIEARRLPADVRDGRG
jgi:hypothetical protein